MSRLSLGGLMLAAAAAWSACAQGGAPANPDGDSSSPSTSCESADAIDGNPCNTDDAEGQCEDAPGGYECFCSAGFTPRSGECVDIDACARGDSTDGNPCNTDDRSATCTDEAPPSTRYACACSPGYAVEAGGCSEIDECLAADNPCDDAGDLGAVCEDLINDVACACSDAVSGTFCSVFGLKGTGVAGDPFVWVDDVSALSCEEYIRPVAPRYDPGGAPANGIYSIDPDGNGDPIEVFCNMTDEDGGWRRVVAWDRAADPAGHTLATLKAVSVDEIGDDPSTDPSPMGELRELATSVRWMDADNTSDVLSYRVPLPAPASEIMASVHLRGSALDHSAVLLFARDEATDTVANLLCEDVAVGKGAYTIREQLLMPYSCESARGFFEHDGLFKTDLGDARADSVVLRSFVSGALITSGRFDDSIELYRLVLFTRSKRSP